MAAQEYWGATRSPSGRPSDRQITLWAPQHSGSAIFNRTYLRAPWELVEPIDIAERLRDVYKSLGGAYGIVGALDRRVLGWNFFFVTGIISLTDM